MIDSDQESVPASVSWHHSRLIIYTMILFGVFGTFFALLAFAVGDVRSMLVFATTAGAVFLGLLVHMIAGLNTGTRIYYACCGAAAFLYLITEGGPNKTGLFGCLAITPGFVAVLGFRLGAAGLAILNLIVGAVFYWDLYLPPGPGFPVLTEIKFFLTLVGLSLFSVAMDYSRYANERGLIEMNRRVHELALRDQLTGLANRRYMDGILETRWEEYKRSGHIYAILLADIDSFKSFNDRYGHEFGDQVLTKVGRALSRGLRNQDVVARWGGDEFLILMPGQTGSSAVQAGERLRKRIEEMTIAHDGDKVSVTISIGIASVDKSLDNNDMLSIADGGLYQAKHLGRNQVVLG